MSLINKKDKIFIAGSEGMVGSAIKRNLIFNNYHNLLCPTRTELDLTDNKKVKFEEKFSFNNQSNKFELEQYKKDIQNDLIDKIVEKLILNLRTTK